MLPKYIPDDINVELLLSYFAEGACKVMMRGLHKRNSYNDIIEIEEGKDNCLHVTVGRKSLYHALPEYMFHPIDRFDNLPRLEEKERFAEEYEKQEQEKENAYRFFAPIDLFLLKIRMDSREALRDITERNKVLYDILGDRMTEEQRNNRFIRQMIPFLPSCKNIRGDKTLLTLLLRKVFLEEGLHIELIYEDKLFCDTEPQYDNQVGSSLEACYVGNQFYENVLNYHIHYWSEEECNENFLTFVEDVEILRSFIQDYFMSVEEMIRFEISHDEIPLRLSDNRFYHYLNYNTNI